MGDPAAASRRAMPGTGYRMQGDPGLFGWVGKVATKAFQTFAPSPLQQALKMGKSIFGNKQRAMPQAFPQLAPAGLPMSNMPVAPRAITLPANPFGAPKGPAQIPAGPSFIPEGGCPAGHRPNKTGYWVTSSLGTPSYVSPGERCVKIRKRNPLNPRALDRSIGRITSAKKAVGKINRITIRAKTC